MKQAEMEINLAASQCLIVAADRLYEIQRVIKKSGRVGLTPALMALSHAALDQIEVVLCETATPSVTLTGDQATVVPPAPRVAGESEP